MLPLAAWPTTRRAARHLANRGQGCGTAFEDPTVSDNVLLYAWSYSLDAVNRATTVTDPLNHTTTTAYWADGRVHTVTDAIGNVTSTTYDFVNKDIATTAAYGTSLAATTTQYLDAAGNVTSVQDPLGHTTTNTLNAVYDLTGVTDPLNHSTSNTLNPNGIPTTSTDALNHSTNYTLNALGETVSTTDATSRTTNTVLDANGQTVATIDSGGNTGLAVFNGAGVNNISIDADGNQTREQFDAAGRLVAFTDADGNTTMWAYDRNGNKIEQWDPTGGTVTWTYNAVNQVTGRTDELGQSETYAYDNAGRLTTELWKNSSGTTVNTITYAYDADNRATSVGDINGTYTYTFDALGRMTNQTDIWNISMTLGYDLANRLTSVTDTLGGTVTNTYDNANRITEKQFTDTSSHALSVGYAYDNANRLTTLSRYSDANETTLISKTTYGFDNANRLTSITHANGSGTTIDSYTYTYNTAGLVGTVSSTLGPSATYTYDPAGQLLSDGTTTYSFDANGNRNSTGYSTNTGNQLATDGTWNYSYNAAGNLIQKTNISTGEVWLYTYNNANQLTLAQHKPSSTGAVDKSVAYTYDVLNNLIETVVDPDGTGQHDVTTKFAYDPNANVWADLNSSAQLTARRIFGAQQDSLIARIDSNGVGWYLTDMLGSVRDDISSTGTLLNHEDFNAWGKLTYQSGASYADRMAFTGRPLDTVTGLQNNRARWYASDTSRWITQEPLGFHAGDSNLYRYVWNTPIGATDPTGNFGIIGSLVVGALAGAAFFGTPQGAQAPAPNQGMIRPLAFDLGGAAIGLPVGALIAGCSILTEMGITYVGSSAWSWLFRSRAPFDPYVGTGSPAGFGNLIGWGTGAQAAAARTASITLQQIQAAGITRAVAQYWLRFYQSAMAAGRGGPTAVARVALMQRVLQLLGGN